MNGNSKKSEILFGEDCQCHDSNMSMKIVGVGPGDPSLLTLGAINAIQDATLIAYPVSVKGGPSLAAQIASNWISVDKKLLEICFPMVKDPIILKNAWKKAGNQLINAVQKGENVVFLSQGDTSLFSTASCSCSLVNAISFVYTSR